jgi:2'-5' RNA ligase
MAEGDSALAIFLPSELAAAVNVWRQHYDPFLNTISPHITVAYPPFIPAADWLAVRPVLGEVLAEFPSFRITFRHTNAFWKPGRVLWLEPEDGGVLVQIDARLKEWFPGYVPVGGELPFTPHATLGFFESDEAMLEAQKAVEAAWQPAQFEVKEITLAINTAGVWKPADTLMLGRRG